ncbi:MAG: DUF3574 domain-containing protein [Alphaproteobacteria bacterium]
MPASRCAPPFAPVTSFALFFGRALPSGGEVTETEWRGFLDSEVASRFPAGFTTTSARGAWRDSATGRTFAERSEVLEIIVPGGEGEARAARAAVEDIAASYRRRFAQQSVLRTERSDCAAF